MVATETVPNMGVDCWAGKTRVGNGIRVPIKMSGADGTRQTHEVASGGGTDPHSTSIRSA